MGQDQTGFLVSPCSPRVTRGQAPAAPPIPRALPHPHDMPDPETLATHTYVRLEVPKAALSGPSAVLQQRRDDAGLQHILQLLRTGPGPGCRGRGIAGRRVTMPRVRAGEHVCRPNARAHRRVERGAPSFRAGHSATIRASRMAHGWCRAVAWPRPDHARGCPLRGAGRGGVAPPQDGRVINVGGRSIEPHRAPFLQKKVSIDRASHLFSQESFSLTRRHRATTAMVTDGPGGRRSPVEPSPLKGHWPHFPGQRTVIAGRWAYTVGSHGTQGFWTTGRTSALFQAPLCSKYKPSADQYTHTGQRRIAADTHHTHRGWCSGGRRWTARDRKVAGSKPGPPRERMNGADDQEEARGAGGVTGGGNPKPKSPVCGMRAPSDEAQGRGLGGCAPPGPHAPTKPTATVDLFHDPTPQPRLHAATERGQWLLPLVCFPSSPATR